MNDKIEEGETSPNKQLAETAIVVSEEGTP